MIKKMPIRRLTAGLGSAVVTLAGVAVLFTTAPAGASTSTAASLRYACKYDGSIIRSSPSIQLNTVVAECRAGTTLFPNCWVRGESSGGDNRWYTWANRSRYIHFSQVTTSGTGGGMAQCS
ncbi:hypothetical protein [Nonomuraea sp. NPDC049607]|uniref:hypothetical protein n=1 Tax=unclassified Nonomuraea TaxID=2593643 RepID=UPI0034357912